MSVLATTFILSRQAGRGIDRQACVLMPLVRRWMALGYITLAAVPPLNQASIAKQTQIRSQIK